MSTQLNTLPAIRALLWERWRVMRWVVPGAWVAYTVWLAVQLTIMTRAEFAERSVMTHAYFAPLLLAATVLALCAHSLDGRSYGFALPRIVLRSPVRAWTLAMVRLTMTLVGVLTLLGGMMLADAVLMGKYALLPGQPRSAALLALLVVALAVTMQAWLLVARNTLVAALPMPFVLWWCMRHLDDWPGASEGSLPFVPTLIVALIVGMGATIPAVQVARRGMLEGISLPRISHSTPRYRGPLKWSGLSATARYEWRSWGQYFFLLSLPVLFVLYWSGYFFALVIAFWVFLALLFGLALQMREFGFSGTRQSSLVLVKPVPTHRLVGHRLAARAGILLAVFAAGFTISVLGYLRLDSMGITGILQPATIILFSVFGTLSIFLAWVALNAGGIAIAFLAVYAAMWAVTYNLFSLPPAANIFVALLILSAIVVRLLVIVRRVEAAPWSVLIICAVLCASVPPIAIAFNIALSSSLTGGRLSPPSMFEYWPFLWALAALAIYAPILWQMYTIDRCRHGGLGWRMGRGR